MKVDNVIFLNQADSAKLPKPVKPNPKLNIALCFLVSLMLSIGSVYFLEYFDDSIKSEADVELYLGLPTLAMVTQIGDGDLKKQGNILASGRKVGELSNVQNH
jgi:capsular polysaccharide biosynthesis protein